MIAKGRNIQMGLDKMEKLMGPMISRNLKLANETPEERLMRIKIEKGLFHGQGIRKKKKQKDKKK